jgi:inhibitor of KinA
MDWPVFRAVADHALLVEFGDRIGKAAHDAVIRLDRRLAAAPFPGFREAIPAFVNLLVDFDPAMTDHIAAETHLRGLLGAAPVPHRDPVTREVLVCYDDDLASDLGAVAARTGLDREAVIRAHLAGEFEVVMYGFAPGYAYLTGVPEPLRLDRKPSPLRGIAAGSVLIAGPQCLVTTMVMPTGWWIIGRSSTRILTGNAARPFLFDVGDRVAFRRIGRADLDRAST